MADSIHIIFDEDGVARAYDDTYDIIIHCESQEEQDAVLEALKWKPEIIYCKDCKYNASSKKCLHPDSFFLVPDDNDYCSHAERKIDETGNTSEGE